VIAGQPALPTSSAWEHSCTTAMLATSADGSRNWTGQWPTTGWEGSIHQSRPNGLVRCGRAGQAGMFALSWPALPSHREILRARNRLRRELRGILRDRQAAWHECPEIRHLFPFDAATALGLARRAGKGGEGRVLQKIAMPSPWPIRDCRMIMHRKLFS
jgi:hypothetical protein